MNDLRDLLPQPFLALTLLLWAYMLVWYARGGRRMLDIGAPARALPRVYLALYYLFIWLQPGVLDAGVAHFMARAGIVTIALSDMIWIYAEWRARQTLSTLPKWLIRVEALVAHVGDAIRSAGQWLRRVFGKKDGEK